MIERGNENLEYKSKRITYSIIFSTIVIIFSIPFSVIQRRLILSNLSFNDLICGLQICMLFLAFIGLIIAFDERENREDPGRVEFAIILGLLAMVIAIGSILMLVWTD